MKYFFIIFSLSISVFANQLADFGQKMSNFYEAPTKGAFELFQTEADKHADAFRKSRNGADILVALMIARISEVNNWPIKSKVFGDRAKEILKGDSKLAKYIADDAKVDPGKLDMWWAQFFATGDERYLEKIFMFAGEDPREFGAKVNLVIGAASWSLKANCKQHKTVKEFVIKKESGGEFSTYKKNYLKSVIKP